MGDLDLGQGKREGQCSVVKHSAGICVLWPSSITQSHDLYDDQAYH